MSAGCLESAQLCFRTSTVIKEELLGFGALLGNKVIKMC